MNQTKVYIGAKLIKAVPVVKIGDITYALGEPTPRAFTKGREEGYRVMYPGGYTSFSPKKVFEECYREVSSKEAEFFVEKVEE